MSDELRTLLHDAAPAPTRQVDPDHIHTRRRRRDHVRTGAVVAATAAVIAVGVALLPPPTPDAPMIDQEPQPQPSPTAPAETNETPAADAPIAQAKPLSWPDGPSQSPEDAAEQDVPPEVAALPIAERIELRGGMQAPEGLYVTSGLPFDVGQQLAGSDGRLSDGTGWGEYEELLLLDPNTLMIQQAWPSAGLSFHEAPTVIDDPDIVVASRSGDGGEPWTGVIVIDRDTRERRGYVSVPDDVQADSPWANTDWVTVNPPDPLPTTLLGTADGLLAAPGGESILLYDPTTFEIADEVAYEDDTVTELPGARPEGVVERGGALFRDGTRIAERPLPTDGEQPTGRVGSDIIASRADGTLLWISRNVPYIVPPGPDTDVATPATTAPSPPWEGAQRRADGSFDHEGFNTHLESRPEVAADPTAVAALLLDASLDGRDVSTDVGDGEATITITSDTSEFDDSVAAVRYEVLLVADGDLWTVQEARWSQLCQDGRGHSEFRAEPCS